jgi:hypothetical protein
MTTTPEELQSKIAQIAGRYLERVVKEVEQLRTLVNDAASGELAVVREIEALTHRMHGSGAMLNFGEISSHAGQLESMSAEFLRVGKVDQPRMLPILQQLQAAIDKACATRRQAAS